MIINKVFPSLLWLIMCSVVILNHSMLLTMCFFKNVNSCICGMLMQIYQKNVDAKYVTLCIK